ncbi:ABC transporter substrate-binding protein [Brevibacillus sp. B_LB10_24]|uniref:ABC transporter substrate-binding protein n=1 Tax=Brevibacillus sp. B_LB10_24 TaxID=3380645 RepID=UPI0038BCDBC0
MRKYLTPFLCLVVSLTLVFQGCSSGTQSSEVTKSEGASSGQSGANTKVLTIAQASDLKTFDTQNSRNTPTATVLRNMFNHLMKLQPGKAPEPELVQSYEQVDDVTWKFKLKEGVKFHNGDTLTSNDVKFTLDRISKDKTVLEYVYYNRIITDVKVIDDLQFEIITKTKAPTLLNLLVKNGSEILPKKYIEENGWDNFLKNPVGTGPYKYVKWIKDDRVILEKYPEYFDGGEREWDQVIVRAIPENSTRVSELLTGGVDLAVNIPPNEWDRIENSQGLSLIKQGHTRVMTLILRTGEGHVTSNPRVREAIELAIDKKALITNVLKNAGNEIRTRVAEGIFGADPDLQNTSLYDPERAKQLLAEVGYPNGVELTLQAPKGRYLLDSEVAEMVAAMLTQAGFKVNLEILEFSALSNVYTTPHAIKDMMLIGLADDLLDASYVLTQFYAENADQLMDYHNAEIDELYEKAASSLDMEERKQAFYRIQKIASDERPQIPLYQEKSIYGVNDRITFTPRFDEQIYFDTITRK